ncbi:MAG: hypothetical protein ABI868_00790 [Acidobacteriota bacterium]
MQPGRDEAPDLIHDERRRQDRTTQHGDVEVEGEPLARPREHERRTVRQRPLRRCENETDDPIDEVEGDRHAARDRHQRPDEAGPELVEMVEKTHPALAPFIVEVLGWHLSGAAGCWCHGAAF